MMVVATRAQQMGPFTAGRALAILGWLATTVMALAVAVMAWSLRKGG